MASYRVLKSVAHNWAHSLLSDSNIAGDTILIQLLLEVARAMQQPELEIDPLEERIFPDQLRTLPIEKSLSSSRRHFVGILERQGCTLEMISKVRLSIVFELKDKFPSYKVINPSVWYSDGIRMPEACQYQAIASIVDVRGKAHIAEVKEYWR